MLVGTHGAGIHIDVGIQLQNRHRVVAGFEEATQAGRYNAFADAGDHSTGDEDKLGHGLDPFPFAF
jgi:hypothetical protein